MKDRSAYYRAWHKAHKAQDNAYDRLHMRRKRLADKELVIRHYSHGTMACANPFGEHEKPYTNILALTIDHVNDDGAEERRKIGKTVGSGTFYALLIKKGYPEGYQVLCWNCQWIKRQRHIKAQIEKMDGKQSNA